MGQQKERMAAYEGYTLPIACMEKADAEVDLSALIDAYSTILFRVAYSILRSRSEAEDVVQDVFLRVLEHRRSLPAVRDLRVWLVRIAWNLALDRRRRSRTDQLDPGFAKALIAGVVPADRALADVQHINAVLDEIDRLPKAERSALLLSAIDELGNSEIADVLGRSESAARPALAGAAAFARTAGAARTTDEGARREIRGRKGNAMEHPEEVVEQILTRLGTVQPPAGMQARLHANLAVHREQPRNVPRSGLLASPAFRRLSALRPAVIAACILVIASVLWTTLPDHRSMHRLPSFTTAKLPVSMASAPIGPNATSHPGPARSTILHTLPRTARFVRRPMADQSAPGLVSFPAPPMPLTQQEHLLLLLNHHVRKTNAPIPDSSAQAAQETEQFQEFFKPEPSIVVNQTSSR